MGKNKLKFTPQKSVDWYNPAQLARTGIKLLISKIFGNFADKRELQTFRKGSGSYDYSNGDEIWIDYISDIGDGFDATYTMAKLLAKPEIVFKELTTKQGEILVMGGDQVYPTPERKEYDNRLIGPYDLANPLDKNQKKRPIIFAIPGNHDWYDGLTNFLKKFSQERNIGNWQTKQKRSYFALKLPSDVWLFGLDIQLNSDIDEGQKEYFVNIMKNEVINKKSKIILCTAEPAWVFKTAIKNDKYSNLYYFERLVRKYCEQSVDVMLSGDLHHYARYEDKKGNHKITSGGGGAYVHPTHNLPESISELGTQRKNKFFLKKVFPSVRDSKKLLFKNLLFPVTSFKLSMFFAALYFIIGTSLNLTIRNSRISEAISIETIVEETLQSPALILLSILVYSLCKFTDSNPYNNKFTIYTYLAFGGIHSFLQAFCIVLSYYFILSWYPTGEEGLSWIVISFIMAGVGLIVPGTLFGIYLTLSNLLLKNHDNEAYSSLRWKGYKNFLRLHITSKELTIYPIGVKNVPKWELENGNTFIPNHEIDCHLIEDPIVISL